MTKFQSGVLTGKQVQDVFTDAKNNLYALPASLIFFQLEQ